MSGPTPETAEARAVITGKRQLIEYLAAGEKPADNWRIGTEHEKFPFLTDTLAPVPYDGARSIKALLEGMRDRFGWMGVYENGNIIALADPNREGSVTLEPGGQFELSGAPLGIGFLGLGAAPTWTRAEMPMMPKGRYGIMAPYMDKVGRYGRDMMFRTCTVQVNLDFSSEADMVKKLRVSLALQPVATALFANSPFLEGKPNGFKSFRSFVWLDTDKNRSGMLPFAFEDGMSYERYVEYALDVPMYFIYRDGHYHNVAGESFRDFLEGKLSRFPGWRPTLKDWSDHLTTIFPEVRLKRYLEMRGADSGSWTPRSPRTVPPTHSPAPKGSTSRWAGRRRTSRSHGTGSSGCPPAAPDRPCRSPHSTVRQPPLNGRDLTGGDHAVAKERPRPLSSMFSTRSSIPAEPLQKTCLPSTAGPGRATSRGYFAILLIENQAPLSARKRNH